MKPKSTVIHLMIHLMTLSWVGWLHWNLAVNEASKEQQQEETRTLLSKPLSTKGSERGLEDHHRDLKPSTPESAVLTAAEVRLIVKEELLRELKKKSQGLSIYPTVSGDISVPLTQDGAHQDPEAQMVAMEGAERILDNALTNRVWTEAHKIELQTILLSIGAEKRFDILSRLSEMVNQNQLQMEVPGPIF